MKLDTVKRTSNQTLPKYLAMAIDKAYLTSDRAGIGWVTIHDNEVIEIYGGYCGYVSSNCFEQRDNFDDSCKLYLSCPPYSLFLNSKELKKTILKLNVDQLHYPKLSENLQKTLNIEEISNTLACEVKTYDIHHIGKSIYDGPISLIKNKRPWTRCLIGSTMSGRNLALDHFFDEFGVKAYLLQKVSQSTSIGVEKGFKVDDLHLKQNSANIAMLYDTIGNIDDVIRLQQQLQRLNSGVLTLLCSFELFSKLMNTNLVDECICHISMLTTAPKLSKHSYSLPIIERDEWKITDSSPLSKGVRIHLVNKMTEKSV